MRRNWPRSTSWCGQRRQAGPAISGIGLFRAGCRHAGPTPEVRRRFGREVGGGACSAGRGWAAAGTRESTRRQRIGAGTMVDLADVVAPWWEFALGRPPSRCSPCSFGKPPGRPSRYWPPVATFAKGRASTIADIAAGRSASARPELAAAWDADPAVSVVRGSAGQAGS